MVTLEPHSVSPVHAHANEQWGVCLEGEWIRIQDGVEHRVRAGDFWQTPPNVPHGGRTLDEVVPGLEGREQPLLLEVMVAPDSLRSGITEAYGPNTGEVTTPLEAKRRRASACSTATRPGTSSTPIPVIRAAST